ncbi:hypothetical protein KY284_020197 [Solanum tuberosum]|nr:hypothetical protein KY284_020197 [Solanum tuberosum]
MRTTTDTLTILFTHSRRRIGFDFVHSRRLISHRLHKRAPTQKLTISLILFKSSERVFSSSSGSHARTLVTLTTAGLKPSRKCESFKNELDPNEINWKGVSNDIRDGYFGEFKKYFYWDSSINEGVVRTQWEVKAATRNRCAGREVAPGTHTGGSLSIGEYRKKLGRDPTPSELHLHIHTHGHDGKSFVGERSRIVHVQAGTLIDPPARIQVQLRGLVPTVLMSLIEAIVDTIFWVFFLYVSTSSQ